MGVGGGRLGNGGEAKKGKGAIQYIRLSPDPQLPQHSAWEAVWNHAESPSLDRQGRQRGEEKGFDECLLYRSRSLGPAAH